MFRVCAWCERLLGVTPPLADPGLTHGICGECSERLHRQELRAGRRSLVIVRRTRTPLRDHLEALAAGLPDVVIRMDTRVGERRQPAVYPGRERRRVDRRRQLHPSQLAAWRALGMFVAQRVS